MIASISSVWPLPSTPAMPTISPRRTVERDVVEQRRRAALGVDGQAHDLERDVGRSTVLSRVSGAGSSLPTIISARSRAVTVDGSVDLGDRAAGADDGDRVGEARAPRRACGR